MNDCKFCVKKEKIKSMNDAGEIWLYEDIYAIYPLLTWDNSASEYAEGTVQIKYCPFCGRRF